MQAIFVSHVYSPREQSFKPNKTQTNSFYLVLSEAVITCDSLHDVGFHLPFLASSKEAAMPTKDSKRDSRNTKVV